MALDENEGNGTGKVKGRVWNRNLKIHAQYGTLSAIGL